MSDHLKSLVFAGVLCVVCSLMLTAASSGLKKYQDRNILIDKNKNILKSVGLIADDRSYPAKEIEQLYKKNIRPEQINDEGNFLPENKASGKGLSLYLYQRDGKIVSYILPIESRGLWGKIYGYLALENDGSTVAGFTVYKHNETPGLGGEIETRWFQKNFKGKKIVSRDGEFLSIAIAKGSVKDAVPDDQKSHYVDGISGATLTGKFLTGGLKKTLEAYEPVSIRFRKNQISQVPDNG